ncbi:MAG TPA: MFS transporter [Mycobacteriales bacterium]|nr:MFS transporter [Mycobacteriales bacterium]
MSAALESLADAVPEQGRNTVSTYPDSDPNAGDKRRWWALGVIAIAQLMVVLDASIVTIALPHAARSLHISDANRQWVQTAYTLTFGSLLLLGGRIADFVGRKRMLVIGLLGFAGASALGGFSQSGAMLFGARAVQGAFAAVLAPAALALISVTFTEATERAKAFGVYGAISGGGAAIGLIAGGLLTSYVSWRWTLFVNIPIAVGAAIAATRIVKESKAEGKHRYDVPGAVLATGGLLALVYGFTKAETDGWGATLPIVLFAAAAVLLGAFVAVERRSTHPLLPVRLVADRTRGGAYLASLLVGVGLFAMFMFMTFYLQGTLGYSALKSGLAFLPFSAGVIVSASIASQVLPRIGPRPMMTYGFAIAAVGLLWLTQVSPTTGYAAHVLPSILLISFGMGQAFVPISSVPLVGIDPADSGVAGALVNTTQQVGGSLGVAVLNTIGASAASSYARAHGGISAASIVHGYTTAFAISAGLLIAAAVVAFTMVRTRKEHLAAVEVALAA